MFSILSNYKDFIFRDLGEIPVPSSFDLVPSHRENVIKWFIIFCLISHLSPYFLNQFSFYKKLTVRKKNEWPSYIVCIIHHLRLIPISIYQIFNDYFREPLPLIRGTKIVPVSYFRTMLNSLGLPVVNETIKLSNVMVPNPTDAYNMALDISKNYTYIGSFCLAYLLADTVCFAIPSAYPVFFHKLKYNLKLKLSKKYMKTDDELKQEIKALQKPSFEFLLHHLASVVLTVSALAADGRIARFIPHVMLCELTGVFFTLAWMVRCVFDIKRGEKFEEEKNDNRLDESKVNKFIRKFMINFVNVLEKLFVICYFFVRVVNLPMCFFSLLAVHKSQGDSFGIYGKLSFVPITLLQWYWFNKIVSTLIPKKPISKDNLKGE